MPNTPPCIVTILCAAAWLPASVAPVPSVMRQALEAAVVRLSHGRMHADIGRDAAEKEALAARRSEEVLEVGREEGALTWLVDNVLGWERLQLVDQLPAWLTAHEDAATRTGLANLGADGGEQPLVLGQVGKARTVAFARMDHANARGTQQRAHLLQRLDGHAWP